jgi:aspartate/glutamate racemase
VADADPLLHAGRWQDAGRMLAADAIVFACTELGLLLARGDLDAAVYDTAHVHARAAVDYVV